MCMYSYWAAYIVPRDRLLRSHGFKETVHRLLELRAVVRDSGFEV